MIDPQLEVDKAVAAFHLGLEVAQLFKQGVYDELHEDDLGSLIGALICQRVRSA